MVSFLIGILVIMYVKIKRCHVTQVGRAICVMCRCANEIAIRSKAIASVPTSVVASSVSMARIVSVAFHYRAVKMADVGILLSAIVTRDTTAFFVKNVRTQFKKKLFTFFFSFFTEHLYLCI